MKFILNRLKILLNDPKIYSIVRSTLGCIIRNFTTRIVKNYSSALFYINSEKRRILNLVNKIRKENELLVLDVEAFQIYACAKATTKLDGDFAEVGVFRGATAKLICEAKGSKNLILFDTFTGLPSPSALDHRYTQNNFQGSLRFVQNYLKKYNNVQIIKGVFPMSAEFIKDHSFAFVHLDVDLYQSTLDCLKFFYPRMVRGGIILTHDYNFDAGVTRAINEFFMDKPEVIIALIGRQCIISKL